MRLQNLGKIFIKRYVKIDFVRNIFLYLDSFTKLADQAMEKAATYKKA